MMHGHRRFCVVDILSAEDLAEKLTHHTWCGCTGFRLGNFVFLNDSTGPDGAQEYAVFDEKEGKQIESITFSWCSESKALEYIRQLSDGTLRTPMTSKMPVIQTPQEHGTCSRCA